MVVPDLIIHVFVYMLLNHRVLQRNLYQRIGKLWSVNIFMSGLTSFLDTSSGADQLLRFSTAKHKLALFHVILTRQSQHG